VRLVPFFLKDLDRIKRIEYILFMPSTTVHIPEDVLSKIDLAARDLGVSRNRFVLQACKEALARQAGEWPKRFFESVHSREDQGLLAEASRELEREVLMRRTNRGAVAL